MFTVYDMIIADPNISREQKQKETEYKKYVDQHIKGVKEAWDKMKNINAIIDFICAEGQSSRSVMIPTIDALVLSHDSSKYGTDEWEAYRKHFYSVDEYEKQGSQAELDKAWEHHYNFNMHHPQHWVNKEERMPMIYVVEMCCDWISVSNMKGGTAYEYLHSKDGNKEGLGETQKEWAEFILKEFYKK